MIETQDQTPAGGKLAVIGDKDIIFPFRAIGADIFPYTNPYKIKEVIKELAARKTHPIILITTSEAAELKDFIAAYETQTYPIILTIPEAERR